VTWVLDAGALVAAERGDRELAIVIADARRRGQTVVTHGGVVGQVWRGGARQARLARLLPGVDVLPLGDRLGRAAGELLARTGGSDVIDAALVVIAGDGDAIITSDPDDIVRLAEAAGVEVDVVAV